MIPQALDIKPCDDGTADFKLLELPYSWQLGQGVFQYAGVPSVIFWAPTSLAAFLAGMYRIAGPERYGYILQSQGRLSEQDDWNYICSFPSFLEGLRGINRVAVTAGWGLMELVRYEPEQKQATMRIYNAWEALCQKALGVCWGSHYFAGKLAGWFSRHFGVNCWCTQTSFSAQGHPYDEFLIAPSPVTVEAELARIDEEEKHRQEHLDAQQRQQELAAVVEQRTSELRFTIERLEQAQAALQAQAATIQQLSIPIVQVWDGILLVSLVGHIDGQRAQHLHTQPPGPVGPRRIRRAEVTVADRRAHEFGLDAGVQRHLAHPRREGRQGEEEAVVVEPDGAGQGIGQPFQGFVGLGVDAGRGFDELQQDLHHLALGAELEGALGHQCRAGVVEAAERGQHVGAQHVVGPLVALGHLDVAAHGQQPVDLLPVQEHRWLWLAILLWRLKIFNLLKLSLT